MEVKESRVQLRTDFEGLTTENERTACSSVSKWFPLSAEKKYLSEVLGALGGEFAIK